MEEFWKHGNGTSGSAKFGKFLYMLGVINCSKMNQLHEFRKLFDQLGRIHRIEDVGMVIYLSYIRGIGISDLNSG